VTIDQSIIYHHATCAQCRAALCKRALCKVGRALVTMSESAEKNLKILLDTPPASVKLSRRQAETGTCKSVLHFVKHDHV
jgi:hypothetical protein